MKTLKFNFMLGEDYEVWAGTGDNGRVAETKVTWDGELCDAIVITDDNGVHFMLVNEDNGAIVGDYMFKTSRAIAICDMLNWEAELDNELMLTLGFIRCI